MVDEHKQMRTAFSEKLKLEVSSKYFPDLGDSYNQTKLYWFFDDSNGFFATEININKWTLVINSAVSGRHYALIKSIEADAQALFRDINGRLKFTITGQEHCRIKIIYDWDLYDRSQWDAGVKWVGTTGDQFIEILYPLIAAYAAQNGLTMSEKYPAPAKFRMTNEFTDIEEAAADLTVLSETERQSVIQSRIGQGKFRELVFELWRSCPITGIENPELLRASHIKPWRSSTNEERLNPYNGLLLTPNYDHLFDKGLITFSDTGRLIMSSGIDAKQARLLGIDDKAEIKGFSPKAIPFLRYHREYVFRKD